MAHDHNTRDSRMSTYTQLLPSTSVQNRSRYSNGVEKPGFGHHIFASINFYENRLRGYRPLSTRSFSQSHSETRIPCPDDPEDQLRALKMEDEDAPRSDLHDITNDNDNNNNDIDNLSALTSPQSSSTSITRSTQCRVVLVGDYKSGVSTLRSEFIRMNDSSAKTESDFRNCARSISVTYNDYSLEIFLFVDVYAFQDFIENLTQPIDCCIACYSSADNETVDSLLNRWLPLFYEYFPTKPVTVCELIDCKSNSNCVWPPNWRSIFSNVRNQLEVSVFEKAGLRLLFDEVVSNCDGFTKKTQKSNRKRTCKIM